MLRKMEDQILNSLKKIQRKMLSYLTITAGFSRVSRIQKYCIHFVEFILLGDEDENFTKKTRIKKWLFNKFKEILLVSLPLTKPSPNHFLTQ